MPPRSETRDITSILTAVSAVNRPELHDNIFAATTGLSYLNGKLGEMVRKAKKIKKTENGGTDITVRLMYGKSKNTGSYEGLEPLTIKRSNKLTSAKYAWKYYHDGAVISGADFRNNGGGGDVDKILDLAQAETKIMELSLSEQMSSNFYGDGTGNSNKNMDGLEAMFVTGATNYGGINATANSWWTATAQTSVGDWVSSGRSALRTQINNASKGSDRPDIILTTQTIYETHMDTLVPHMRITNEKAEGLGFKNLLFDGEIGMFWDADITAGVLYALNGRYLSWTVHKDADFAMTPWKNRLETGDQDALTQHIIVQGNLTCANRKRQVKLSGITTT
jgi:hypothetical protein